MKGLYTNKLKNREFDKKGPQNFCSERATIAEWQGASENKNYEAAESRKRSEGPFSRGAGERRELARRDPTKSKINSSSFLCILMVFSLLLATGCSDIKQMNTNLEDSIQSVKENTKTVQHSSEVISKNTQEISLSTKTMRFYLPPVLLVILLVLFIPSMILIRHQRKFLRDIKAMLDWMKKH
jgi:hypothetical protein